MLANPLDAAAVIETADEVARRLDLTEARLAAEMGLDRKRLRAELLRQLREDEIGEYAHGGLVADWLYYRTAIADWAATSSRSPVPEEAPPPTKSSDTPTSRGPHEAAFAASGLSIVLGILHRGVKYIIPLEKARKNAMEGRPIVAHRENEGN